MREEIQFLKDLQEELKTQEIDCQASPRFWVLMDYRWVTAPEDDYERISLYFSEQAEAYPLNECIQDIFENEDDEYDEYEIEELRLSLIHI